jgi:hypothetical protein
MADAAFLELLASFESALGVANRGMTVARALADGYRSGVFPPEVVLDAYLVSFQRDAAQLGELREKLQHFKDLLSTN